MANHHELDQAVKRHVGDAVAGLREDFAEMMKKTQQPVKTAERCKVTGPGYTEQFTSLAAAQKAYDGIKKRLIKSETPGTVKLFTERDGTPNKWDVVQQWKGNEDSFS